MKTCSKCKQSKLLSEFNFKNKESDKYQSQCKSCTRNFVKNHYNRNKDYYLAKANKRNKQIREEINAYIKQYLQSHPCVDCGESNPVVLEFDHTSSIEKYKAVSNLMRDRASLEVVKLEISKCEVRCANCHKKKTAKDFNWFKQMLP